MRAEIRLLWLVAFTPALVLAAPPKTAVVVREGTAATSPATVAVPQALVSAQAALSAFSKQQAKGASVETFRWRPDTVYQVRIKAGMFASISIPKDEPILQFAVSDPASVELSVNADANIGMLRLVNPVTLIATVVTKARVYYLNVTPSEDTWHQGVSFVFDSETNGNGGTFGYRATSATPSPQTALPAGQPESPSPDMSHGLAGHPNFDYSAEGDQAIKPVSVWDNGRWTWIQFSSAVQSIPAVFYLGASGPEVVNFTIQPGGKQILVNRLMDKFLLRLGVLQVVVTAK